MVSRTAAAQSPGSNSTVVSNAMFAQTGGKYVGPKCSADKGKHYKVSSGATYLSSAVQEGPDPKSQKLLESGARVTTEAITQDGQDKAPSAWYTLGRIQLFEGDVAGADTSLKKAEALAPDCKDEINLLRRIAFVPLVQEAQKEADAKNLAGATALYRQAAGIYPASPYATYNLATLFAEQKQLDSAAKYFQAASNSTSSDTNDVKIKKLAQFNGAVMLLNAGKAAEAVPLLEAYVQANPNDADAKRGLASAYRATGQNDKARALDAQTGVSTAAGPTLNADLDGALKLYNEKKYAEAAAAFDKVLAAEPYNVTALAAQANAYLALKDGPKLAAAATRLSEIEPLNRDALMLTREGYRLSKQTDKANAAAEKILGQSTSVAVTSLTLGPNSAALGGVATGQEALDAKSGKAVPGTPRTLTFEFLDKSGAVINSQDVSIPALAKDETKDFSLEGKGEGIVGYRYKVKA
jgi:tetratricopeptide (TPR) repeat protein